jgi:hypothetical protein
MDKSTDLVFANEQELFADLMNRELAIREQIAFGLDRGEAMRVIDTSESWC